MMDTKVMHVRHSAGERTPISHAQLASPICASVNVRFVVSTLHEYKYEFQSYTKLWFSGNVCYILYHLAASIKIQIVVPYLANTKKYGDRNTPFCFQIHGSRSPFNCCYRSSNKTLSPCLEVVAMQLLASLQNHPYRDSLPDPRLGHLRRAFRNYQLPFATNIIPLHLSTSPWYPITAHPMSCPRPRCRCFPPARRDCSNAISGWFLALNIQHNVRMLFTIDKWCLGPSDEESAAKIPTGQ